MRIRNIFSSKINNKYAKKNKLLTPVATTNVLSTKISQRKF